MMEVAFDIASGANFKFNTANIGEGVCLPTVQPNYRSHYSYTLFMNCEKTVHSYNLFTDAVTVEAFTPQ